MTEQSRTQTASDEARAAARRRRRRAGSVPVEYGMIGLLVAVLLTATWTTLGESLLQLYEQELNDRLTAAMQGNQNP